MINLLLAYYINLSNLFTVSKCWVCNFTNQYNKLKSRLIANMMINKLDVKGSKDKLFINGFNMCKMLFNY